MGKQFKANRRRFIPSPPSKSGSMRMFDLNNPDIDLFNRVDHELIGLAGSQLYIYKYEVDENSDDVFGENRVKVIRQEPTLVKGHYDPRAIEENLTEFGIEMTNDQTFTFNKSYLDSRLGRPLIPGDIIQPRFQNIFYDVYEVQEDSFEAYGVYHLVASARVLREKPKIMPELGGSWSPQEKEKEFALYQTQRTNIEFGKRYTSLQQKYVRRNVPTILFDRSAPKVFRDSWIVAGHENNAGLYADFTTVIPSEAEANPSWVNNWVRHDVQGDPIIAPGGQYLMDFGNTDWLDARLASFPDSQTDPTLKNSNLSYLFLDLCNLYPVQHLGGAAYREAGGTAAEWRSEMLGMIEYVRGKIDLGVNIVTNSVRAQVGETDENGVAYIENPVSWYPYDGADVFRITNPPVASVIETNNRYGVEGPFTHHSWIYKLAVVVRILEDSNIPTVLLSMHAHIDEELGIVSEIERLSNWASYALIHKPGKTRFAQHLAQTHAVGNTPILFPENGIDLGYPVQGSRGKVPAYFSDSNELGQLIYLPQVLAREFDSGYVALFNTGIPNEAEALPIPAEYQEGYELVGMTPHILLGLDGVFSGELTSAPMPPEIHIPPGRGFMIKKSD